MFMFRVATICSDNTGSIPIIFPDGEVSGITDKTVVDIHCDCLKVTTVHNFTNFLWYF